MIRKPSNSKDTSEVDRAIGSKINELRISMGITRQDLASQVGVTHQQLQKYERGVNRITVSRLFDISRALNVPITVFIDSASGEEDFSAGENVKQRMCVETMRDFLSIKRQDQQDAVRKLIRALVQ